MLSRSRNLFKLKYTPCLDGLRAISILYVLCFHGLGPISSALTGSCGWIGVDNFFVISGFLITCLFVQEWSTSGKLDLKAFYFRRMLRIAPAYYAFLGFMTIKWLASGNNLLIPTAVSAIYMTDYDTALGWGFWRITSLGHLWSLAVEEKFYLLYPLLLKTLRTSALAACGVTILLVEIWKSYLVFQNVNSLRLGNAFDTNLDLLLVGCVAALVWTKPGARSFLTNMLKKEWIVASIALLVILSAQSFGLPSAPSTVQDKLFFWIVKRPANAFFFAVLILALFSNSKTFVVKALELRPLVWLGKISYSLYLWHGFAFHLVNDRFAEQFHLVPQSAFCELLRFLMSIGIASISYYLIEKPFLALKHLRLPKSKMPISPRLGTVPEPTDLADAIQV